MTIQIGDTIPNVTLMTMSEAGPAPLITDDFFKGKKTVVFGVPGAFTPTCSARHLPGFVEKSAEILAKGVDQIACLSVNDPFVMGAWAKSAEASEKITMLADGNADLTAALGLEMDGSKFGLGKRAKRFAMVVEDGKVTVLDIEAPGAFDVSSAEAVLAKL